jgi:hypothetical protein
VDPTVVRAVQRAVVAFLVTFVVGSGVVFAMNAAGDGGTEAGATSSSVDPSEPGGGTVAVIPNAYLVWMPEGFPDGVSERLTELRGVRRVAVASAGVAWLTRSVDENGEVVDAPVSGLTVPLEVTGVDPRGFAWFLEPGDDHDAIASLEPDQAILSASAAKLRGLEPGATLEFDDGLQLQVAAVLPDVVVGAYELLVTRATADERFDAVPRYALLRMRKAATPGAERVTADVTELMPEVREPAVEVRTPGQADLLRAFDRSLPPVALKRRFGEFTASWDGVSSLVIDERWQEERIQTKEVPRLGTVTCNRRTLFLLRKAMAQVPDETSLGEIGPCFDVTWTPTMPQGTLPAALWGASIRLNVALNTPGNPPFMEASIREPMGRWGFRWAGEDAYPDGSLFEYVRPPERTDTATPSPTD